MKEALCSEGNMHLNLGSESAMMISITSTNQINVQLLLLIVQPFRALQSCKKQESANQNVSGTPEYANQNVSETPKASGKRRQNGRHLLRSESISASRCVGVIRKPHGVHSEVQ